MEKEKFKEQKDEYQEKLRLIQDLAKTGLLLRRTCLLFQLPIKMAREWSML